MDENYNLPFEVGQSIEARSFLKGYRGAWFRSKIRDINSRRGQLGHVLHYTDFPDEKEKWTKLYQVPPIGWKKGIEKKRQLIVRPEYPSIYHESQMPLASAILEVIVISDSKWKVGDLVDWWKDGCYWSGTVTKVLGTEKAEVELAPPPMGEGNSYEVSFSDLRPSLDWTPEDGWTVPTPKDGVKCRQCARLIHPVNQAGGDALPLEMPAPGDRTMDGRDGGPLKASWSDSSSPSNIRDGSAETAKVANGKDLSDSVCPQKKFRASGGISSNSTWSDEAAILGLEELVNKLKWMKGILKVGTPFSDVVKPSWKFVEHRGSSIPK